MSTAPQKARSPEVAPPQTRTALRSTPEPRRAGGPAREPGGNHARAGPLPAERSEVRPGEGLRLVTETPEPKDGGKESEPEAEGNSTRAYLAAMDTPPSRMASAWTTAGAQAAGTFVKQQKALDMTLPTLTAKLDGAGTKAVETVKPEKPDPKLAARVEIAPGKQPAALPLPAPTPALRSTENSEASKKLAATTGQDPAALQQDGARLIEGLSTGADVETDPGPPPPVPLTEGADPARAADAEKDSSEAAEKTRTDASQAIVKGPGPAQVQPAKLDVEHKVPPTSPGAMPGLESMPGMDQVTGWKLDPKAAAAFDRQAQPKMAEHLGRSKAELGRAETQRKTDREAAVKDGRSKVAAANTQADAKQAKHVGDVRDQIVGEQKETLQKQRDAVAGLRKDTAGQRTETLDAVDGRVKNDQKTIGEDFKQAKTDAQKEQKKSEIEANAEKDKASRESKNKSWWDKAVDFVKDAIDKVAKAIDGILSALKKSVGAILDKVKKAAFELIDKARKWINEKLDQFGAWLKKAVTALLGDLFPELTKKINAFIDKKIEQAKAAVNAVADGLKKAVSALVDGLKKALDKVIDGFRAAVKAAAALAKALVSGDWAAVAQMLLEGILALLGIDPAEFYAFIAKIKNTIGKIVDAPGVFVGHLISAVIQGFRQFTDKILDYLKAGILQWLFGAVAEGGITLPKKFDIAGVLDLVLQVLGLTKARLRAKAVKLIGEKNVERIEFVWQFISAAIEGGLSGLWEKIKEFLGGLWDMVIGAAQQWLITTLVKKAIVKLVSLFNPLGAIIQLILTAWDVYLWVRDNAKRIVELVRAVVDSVAEIAAGAIAKAAGWIEGALGKLVPIAINLLANIIGLGGIGEKIKEIITGIQNAVDKAIDSLINKVVGFFKGVGKKEAAAGTLDESVPFSGGGEQHRVFLEVNGEDAELMIESKKSGLGPYLAEVAKKAEADPMLAKDLGGRVKKAEGLLPQTTGKAKEVLKAMVQHRAPNAQDKEMVDKDVKELAELLSEIVDAAASHSGLDVPQVGSYDGLTSFKSTDSVKYSVYTPHHVPPKGLAKWFWSQISTIPQEILEADPDLQKYVRPAAALSEEEMGGGAKLSCVLIHQETHITKTDDPPVDSFRAHYGKSTSELLEERLIDRNLPLSKQQLLLIRRSGDKLAGADLAQAKKEKEEEAGANKILPGMPSTQFYQAELNAALANVKAQRKQEVATFCGSSIREVFYSAWIQSSNAVAIALAASLGKDGTAEKQKSELGKLKREAATAWQANYDSDKVLTRF